MKRTREEILDSMKRSIKENGGKPFGKKRFSDKYEIPIYEIDGFWPKYSDLVIEAGGTPNEPHRKYREGFLEEKVVHLIRKDGRFPTLNTLRVLHTYNQDFPFRAIKRRWPHFLRDVVRFCEKNSSYDDILKICQPKLERLAEEKRNDVANNSSLSVGQVYLYKSGRYYKIGFSKDPVRRGKEIKLELPEQLKMIHSFETDDPSGVEAYWHKRFESKRHKETEFFKLDSRDIQAFKRWKKIY